MKRTLQEWADFTGCYVAMSEAGTWLFPEKPELFDDRWVGDDAALIDTEKLIDYSGEWRDSLTAPSEPPFKEGELVVSYTYGTNWTSSWRNGFNKDSWRRPTAEEWRTLRGED